MAVLPDRACGSPYGPPDSATPAHVSRSRCPRVYSKTVIGLMLPSARL